MRMNAISFVDLLLAYIWKSLCCGTWSWK